MKTETWLERMVKDIESQNPKPEKEVNVKLSESDMNHLADLMIKKMGDEPEHTKDETPIKKQETNTPSVDADETPIEEEI